MNRYVPRKLSAIALAMTAALSVPATSTAQAVLEEVLVTATRRGETDVQTTPVSVTAVSGEDFDKLFANDIGEIAAYVPNFSAATISGFNAASFAMRGAGETDIIVYFDPKVGVIVDDFVVPHVQTQLLEPFDIEAVEVLRGPQGTLFGKNTTSGAVVVRTKRPEMDTRSIEASFRYGNYDTKVGRFAANWGGEQFAVRFAGMYQDRDGYYKNGKVENPVNAFGGAVGDAAAVVGTTVAGDGGHLGGMEVFSGRLKALWEPNEDISILAQYEIIRDSSDPVPAVNVTPDGAPQLARIFGFPGVTSGDPLKQAGNHESALVGLDGNQRVDVDGGYLNIEWDLGSHKLFANAGYRYQESRLPNEYLGTPYNSFFAASRDDDRETLQIEARIASDFDDSRWNYVVGAFYQENDVEFCVLQQLGLLEFFGAIPGGAIPGILDNSNPLLLCNAQDATSWAVFADVSFDVTDRVQLSGGVRWTHEKKEYIGREGTPIGFLGAADPQVFIDRPLEGQDFDGLAGNVATDSETWEEPTWRATLSFAATDDIFTYLTVSRGFKSGGYNDQAGSGTFANFPLQSYDPEFATNIEFGLKGDFLDGRLRTNVTFFTVEYDDFQRSTVVQVPGTAFQETRTFNAAQVSAQGIEAEGSFLITDDLVLRANIGVLDAEYDSFLLDRDADGIPELDLSGRDVARAPSTTGGLDLTYTQALASRGNIRWNFNFAYEAENIYYYNDDLGAQFDTTLNERTIYNISATWTDPADRYTISAFGKNLSDDRYRTASQAVGTLWTQANYGAPRTYGIEAGVKFDF